jgi:hypothetical protein
MPWPALKDCGYEFLLVLLSGIPNPGVTNFAILVIEQTRSATLRH